MYTFIGGILLLIIGFFTYGKIVEKNFGIVPDRQTPAFSHRDNLDYVPMPRWKNLIIELLNIAGTGPIFGPIMGALYGPVAYIWIVFGCIFAGAVHDYMTGMISLRFNGMQLPELASRLLGKGTRHIVNIFSILLLLLVGTVFVISPATLIQSMLPFSISLIVITILIFVFYLISTVLPIDKTLGKIYPWFGAILILSTGAIGICLLFSGHNLPNLTAASLKNMHPAGMPIFPGMFFTISCGALSGFHATQAPMVSRTLENESEGRSVFYGMMIAEGVIAMIWAAASMSLFDGQTLMQIIDQGTPSLVVNKVSYMLLGSTLGTIAITGVIVLPISSGLSAFRSCRLILAEYFKVKQDTLGKILMVTLPLYAISFGLTFVNFNILWRYFNWANQTTAMIALFVASRYLYLKGKNYFMTLVPGSLMLYAVFMYILSEHIGFNMGLTTFSYSLGALLTCGVIAAFFITGKKKKEGLPTTAFVLNDDRMILE